jgi:hypothetical protein
MPNSCSQPIEYDIRNYTNLAAMSEYKYIIMDKTLAIPKATVDPSKDW